jgi:hypothetical protein
VKAFAQYTVIRRSGASREDRVGRAHLTD